MTRAGSRKQKLDPKPREHPPRRGSRARGNWRKIALLFEDSLLYGSSRVFSSGSIALKRRLHHAHGSPVRNRNIYASSSGCRSPLSPADMVAVQAGPTPGGSTRSRSPRPTGGRIFFWPAPGRRRREGWRGVLDPHACRPAALSSDPIIPEQEVAGLRSRLQLIVETSKRRNSAPGRGVGSR